MSPSPAQIARAFSVRSLMFLVQKSHPLSNVPSFGSPSILSKKKHSIGKTMQLQIGFRLSEFFANIIWTLLICVPSCPRKSAPEVKNFPGHYCSPGKEGQALPWMFAWPTEASSPILNRAPHMCGQQAGRHPDSPMAMARKYTCSMCATGAAAHPTFWKAIIAFEFHSTSWFSLG
jgi:hypothetical protein